MSPTELNNKIIQAEARIQQLLTSELFSEAEREQQIRKANAELEELLLEKAKNIDVDLK